MLSELYNTIYRAFSGGIAGLQLLTLSPMPTTLTEIVQADKIQNPYIIVQQRKTSLEGLESFLNVRYKIENRPGAFGARGGLKKELEGPGFVYYTEKNPAGKKHHIILYFGSSSPTALPQFIVVLMEGESVARVIDPDRRFNEAHFKEKIRVYLEQKKAKGEKYL